VSTCNYCQRPLAFEALGHCSRCGTWNDTGAGAISSVSKSKTTTLDQVEASTIERLVTGGPWDECWGGGFVPSSVTLAGGPPGAGKTTLLLQVASRLATVTGHRAYFISSEQAPGEIRLTANRLGLSNLDRFRVLSAIGGGGADVDEDLLREDPPSCFILDSVSAMCGKDRGATVTVAKAYKKLATLFNAPAFLISHMSKEFDYSGLLQLQHEVDVLATVAHPTDREADKLVKAGHELDDEALGSLRVLVSWKNRYAATGKEHYLVMTPLGLVGLTPPVPKPAKAKRLRPVPVEEAPEVPRRRARAAPAPDALDMDGQRLVRKTKKTARAARP
jgi:DNA repair protein RadA/Sms